MLNSNDEIRKLLDAEDEGKEIQYQSTLDGAGWLKKRTMWDFPKLEYRVKPVEPKSVYLVYRTFEEVCSAPAGKLMHMAKAYKVGDVDEYNPNEEYIQLTDEVRATLTEKGILKC